MIIGTIKNVINAYYFTRITNGYGKYFAIYNNVKINKNNFYAIIKIENNIIQIKNIFYENINEFNIFFDEQNYEDFEITDDNSILINFINNNKNYDFYIIEYKPNVLLFDSFEIELNNKIIKLENNINILKKLKEKTNKSIFNKLISFFF